MKKLERTITQTTDEHEVIDVIHSLNSTGQKALSFDKLDEEVLKNKGYYWSGLLIAYPTIGKKLGSTVQYNGYTLVVPKKLQDTDDQHCLIIGHEHLDADVETKTITVKKSHEKYVLVEKMNRKNGWYSTNKWKFPNGKPSTVDDKDARYFWSQTDAYVGLLARYGNGDFYGRRNVYAGQGPSGALGVLIE